MTYLLIGLAIPFAGALLMLALAGFSSRTRGFTAIGLAFLATLSTLRGSLPIFAGQSLSRSYGWFPELGIQVAFMADGLSVLFALLITGIGTLICVYAVGYLHEERIDTFFWFSLLLFMGSMIGVVLSADIITLLVFWELTSISSFLLIGIEYWRDESRRGALNALFVTAAGGLCLLAALLLLASHFGTFSLPVMLDQTLTPGPVVTSAMVLLLLGAFTKSAHVPFHFWLPQAMAAPTPVSAYLHSATMVKAGIYLIARFYPLFAPHPYWSPIIMVMGLVTFAVGGVMAIAQEDAKALLAYSTISQLGMITFMLGIGTPAALLGGLFHILAHATFKGSLFMGAGAIDHTLGTRELDKIGPLSKSMPLVAAAMGLAALSMAGVIPFSGFVSKEAMFEGVHELHTPGSTWLMTGAVVASVFTFLYSMRFVFELPFGAARTEYSGGPEHSPHGLDKFCLQAPTALLSAATVLLGLSVGAFAGPLPKIVNNAMLGVGAALSHHLHYHIALWHGFKFPLLMTGIVVGVGLLLYLLLPVMRGFWRELSRLPGPEDANRAFQDNLVDVTHDVMDYVIQGPLSKFLRIMIGTTVFLGFLAWFEATPELAAFPLVPSPELSHLWIPFLLVIFGGLSMLRFSRPVPAVIALGAVGFLVSTIFLVYHAPDLILTQISVETVSIVIFLWVLKDIDFPETADTGFRPGDALLALVASGGVCYFLLQTLSTKQGLTDLARYFVEYSVPKAWGHNMVNVILVDFRALDTLGEISVLGIATLGILALLNVVFRPLQAEESS